MHRYKDRYEAGGILAEHLIELTKKPNTIVLGLPRGGVPVAYEIATRLSLPLDIFIVRKLGVPGYKELAMGAIASGDTVIFNESIMQELNIDKAALQSVIEEERIDLLRREKRYRGNRPPPSLQGKTIILVDDGIATGSSIRAAIEALNQQKPASLIVAVPVAACATRDALIPLVDQVICTLTPINFYAVGFWYESFPQTSDEEVIELLNKDTQQEPS